MRLLIRTERGRYREATGQEIMDAAAPYHGKSLIGASLLDSPNAVIQQLRTMVGGFEHEVFGALYLTNRHHVIAWDILFRGTIDGASVHPREVVKSALAHNAAAVILFHNHPSGVLEPSEADKMITRRLKDALGLIDIRTLDHIIISVNGATSFAERGLI